MAGKKKSGAPKSKTSTTSDDGGDERKSARRVALMRNKLTEAMQDPITRDQIVKAIRSMMQEK